MKILKKLKNIISKYFYDLFHFNIKVAHYNFVGELADFNIIKGNKKDIIQNKRKEVIYNYLMKRYHDYINEYKNKSIEIGDNSKKIWCLWWQGLDNAPDLVKKCINSIKSNKGDYEFILLTKDNYRNYSDLPEFIIDKVNKGDITITHFSDILRGNLLKNHGGVWVDATMYFTYNVFDEFNNITFNSNRQKNTGDYCGFFIGGKPNKIFYFLNDFLIKYNSDYKRLINYFLIDYTFLIMYRNFPECKDLIDNITINNGNLYELAKQFNNLYHEEEYKNLTNNTFFKLTYKKDFKEYKNDKLTNYGYFINNK